jgi:hypothetical protein
LNLPNWFLFVRDQAGAITHKRKQSSMKTKTKMMLLIAAAFAVSVVSVILARPDKQPNENMWQTISERSVDQAAKRSIVPLAYRTVRLDSAALTALLASAPMEFTRQVSENPIIEIPMPNGTLARFHFEESPVVEPGLAAQYPDWKTYRAQGIDDPTATLRFDWLPSGFHAIILTPSGTVLVDPYVEGNTADYISYWKKDAANVTQPFECQFDEPNLPQPAKHGDLMLDAVSDSKLRTYRLAVAATHEYTASAGNNSTSGTLAAEVVVINRINAIYEREVAVHLNIISNNAAITYASDRLCGPVACNNDNDPYTNSNCALMAGENHDNLPGVIGIANYDIGHVFSTCGGGSANLGVVCGEVKERGSTGRAAPDDPTSTSYVAHEIGHQFFTNHSFNGIAGSCAESTRSAVSAYEVGSGITFMSYVGACATSELTQNLGAQADFIDIFTVNGLENVISFIQSLDGTCGVVTNTGKPPPTVSGPGNFTIPKQTPFSLTATAFERNTTYDWEEFDLGPAATTIPNSDADGARPIFRLYAPTAQRTRYFPSLQFVLNNSNVPPTLTAGGYLTGELLPAISRTMVFKAVVRDNRAGGGGVNTAQSSVTIDVNATPFAVTSPNAPVIISPLTNFTVTWTASGNAANVKISLSTDGGNTFPTVLAASTPNDGAQSVFIPNTITTQGRIKVEAVDNIYFDVSDTNFTISFPWW